MAAEQHIGVVGKACADSQAGPSVNEDGSRSRLRIGLPDGLEGVYAMGPPDARCGP